MSDRPRAAIVRVAHDHPLAVLLLVHLALKLALLTTGLERVAFDEELYRGAVAKELIDGLKMPLASYRPDPYSGGFLLVAVLAVPPFLLLGPTLIALKLVPLACSLGILALLFVFLDRWFGRRAALAGAVLFVCAPPGPTQLSLVAMGFHTESVLFSMLILLAWYRVLAEPARSPRLALFGLAVGAGISFTFVTALTGLACAGSAVLARRRPSVRGLGWLALGFAVGLLPYAIYDATHGFEGVRWADDLLRPQLVDAAHSPLAVMYRVARKTGGVLLIGLPQANAFPALGVIPGRALSYLYWILGVAVLGVFVLRRRGVAATAAPLWLWAGMLVGAFVLTGYDVPRHDAVLGFINFRFMAPLHFVMLLLVGIALGALGRAGRVLLVLAGLGLLGQGMLLSFEVPRHLQAYWGYSYVQVGQVWAARLYPRSETFAEASPVLARFPEAARRLVFWGLLDNTQARWPDPLAALSRIDEVPGPFRVHFAEALGGALTHRIDGERLTDVAVSLAPQEQGYLYRGYATNAGDTWTGLWERRGEFAGRPPPLRRWFHFRLGVLAATECSEGGTANCDAAMAQIRRLDEASRAWAYRGVGQVAAQNFLGLLVFEERRAAGEEVPPAHLADFFWGVGWELRTALKDDRARTLDWIDRLPVEGRPAALEGLAACEAWFSL